MKKNGKANSDLIIGIDLGTTNCTVAYAIKSDAHPQIQQFLIPQIIGGGIVGESYALPSFLYFPLAEEAKKKIADLGWSSQSSPIAGAFAQERGSEVPDRLIASAKSWLCHASVNRRDKLLPLQSEQEKMSPLEACSALLRHIREAWDAKMPDYPFIQQQILITVPASFDPSARQLVEEAASFAGYPGVILLEEPQAAFYAWLQRHEKDWRKQLSVGDTILVVDVGGGTTDFSLITTANNDGNITLERLAVGSHLLLGGDNIDLALAHLTKSKLEEKGYEIDDWQLQSLVHSCRQAKEKLMTLDGPRSADITIMGRGTRLIGGSLKTSITKEEAVETIVNGFIPILSICERSLAEKRVGLQQVGLPYVQDPRISCQLAKFLSMTGDSDHKSTESFVQPTHVLFNGGTMKAEMLRKRLIEVLNNWAGELGKQPIKELPGPDYDFAVSRGAVYYGLARNGHAIRIKSGTSRSYYIGVEDAAPAVPGIVPPMKAICLVPFGQEEGTELELSTQEFALTVGEPATFRFFSHAAPKLSNGVESAVGAVVRGWKNELTELHPIETVLEKQAADNKVVHVRLKSVVTELGFLELWCVAGDGRKWKLEFDIRKE